MGRKIPPIVPPFALFASQSHHPDRTLKKCIAKTVCVVGHVSFHGAMSALRGFVQFMTLKIMKARRAHVPAVLSTWVRLAVRLFNTGAECEDVEYRPFGWHYLVAILDLGLSP